MPALPRPARFVLPFSVSVSPQRLINFYTLCVSLYPLSPINYTKAEISCGLLLHPQGIQCYLLYSNYSIYFNVIGCSSFEYADKALYIQGHLIYDQVGNTG